LQSRAWFSQTFAFIDEIQFLPNVAKQVFNRRLASMHRCIPNFDLFPSPLLTKLSPTGQAKFGKHPCLERTGTLPLEERGSQARESVLRFSSEPGTTVRLDRTPTRCFIYPRCNMCGHNVRVCEEARLPRNKHVTCPHKYCQEKNVESLRQLSMILRQIPGEKAAMFENVKVRFPWACCHRTPCDE
jgi:hypothetical protein